MIKKLKDEIKNAMRSTDKVRLTTLRGLLSEVQKIAINDRRKDITEADLIDAVSKGIKQRNDSITQFKNGGRDDLVAIEEAELEIYKEFQPQQMSEENITALVDKVIHNIGASSKKDMGRVMSAINKEITKGTVDMKNLSQLVMSKLQ